MKWLPIEKEKKLKNGFVRIYSFKEEVHPRSESLTLKRAYRADSYMGYRTCDLYIDIPEPQTED